MNALTEYSFEDLLLEYSRKELAHERREIEAHLWDNYGQELAVLVLDMSGFSLLTQRYGVVHYLSMIRQMQLTSAPIIEHHGGWVIKFEADNCFAVFPDVLGAVKAVIELNTTFRELNKETPQEFDVRISCGIDYGKILLVGKHDFFGNAVNLASKLGEDVAGPGELLITREAFEIISDELDISGDALNLSISGIEVEAISIPVHAS